MIINVVVLDQTVTIDGESYLCPDLIAPEDWAWAYHWNGQAGVIEPKGWLGRDSEHFIDPARMDFAVEAFSQARAKLESPPA